MRKSKLILALASLVIFASCSTHEKKILIYASNDIQVDEGQKNITVTEGTTHHEKILEFKGSSPVTLNIQSPSGKFSLQANEDGLYIANLKPDTVVGSYQHVGADTGMVKISSQSLQARIDSLRKLIADANVNAANRNYFIQPNTIRKITDKTNAKVFGPFTTVPSGFDASSVPEIYKFYAVKEVREIIDRLTGMGK
ncbi:MAG: hypothetical protein JST47_03470 [Bacteroidetes bacterium]|nr:hypothetical protein [Bacteroidota bacterium]MBS1973474.1 hypothetical protein [Bacteroidota bacterium]